MNKFEEQNVVEVEPNNNDDNIATTPPIVIGNAKSRTSNLPAQGRLVTNFLTFII